MISLMIPIIEIAILTVIIYFLLSFSRGVEVVYAALIYLTLFVFVNIFHLPVLKKLMIYIANVGVIALLIIFQSELRFTLSKLGIRGKKFQKIKEFDNFLDSLTQSVYRLAERRTGAIIVLENQDSLDEFANKAVILHSEFSSELLESIFITTTPLHDGAVIIRGTTILSAATILPLAEDTGQLTKTMGTRHRAGLGISQITDALVIIISEETGKVSIAREGIITRGVKMDRFKGIIRSIFNPPKIPISSKWNVKDQLGKLRGQS